MLQWMGGARRKVTSTRMSTQKRQKQYFEQRRRQHQVAEGRKDFEGQNIHGQHTENSRSLDILSLLNLSTVAQENRSNYPLGRNESEHDALNYQALKCPEPIQSFQTNDVTPSGPSEVDESRSSLSYQPRNACRKTMLVSTFGKDAGTLNSDDDKINQFKMVPEFQELDMMEILGYEESNLRSSTSSEHEAHAAFSIEGLGKVEMETPVHTPVHSPDMYGRTFLHGCSPTSKVMKPAYPSNLNSELVNLEFGLDAMMQEVEASLCKSSLDHSFCSKDILGFLSKPKQELIETKEFSIFDDSDSGCTDLLGNDEPFFHKRERNRHIWDATSGPLPGDILDESAFGLSYNNWMDQPDASDDYYSLDCRKKEFKFQGSFRQKSRTTMSKSGKLGCIESPELYVKRQKSENFHDSIIPEMTWRSPVRRDHSVGDIADQPTWSCFITEDTRDNLSLLSEESCSSSAVRGVSNKGTLNSKEKRTSKGDFGCSENICSENIISGREKTCNKLKTPQQGENKNGPGKFTRISNSSRPKPAVNSNTNYEKRLKPEDGRFFEGASDPGMTISGHKSGQKTSETTKYSSSSSRLWIEDLFGTSGDPKLKDSERFSKSAHCSPCCNLTSEKHDFRQPKLKNITSVSSVLNLSEHCNMGFPESEQQSIIREENENSDLPASEHGKLEQQRDISSCRKSLSSEHGKLTYGADAEDKFINGKESTGGTSEVGEAVKETNCLEDDEETSPSVATSSIDGNSCHVDTKCQLDAQASLLRQTGYGANLGLECIGPEQRRTENDRQSGFDSTCQVMTLDSCVLQLLCIQVLKEASDKVTGNKA